ncbi:transglutaminase domain-containing protein [Blautia massiliensis (ex Durand et al. 2017)]|uniref:transglutaminase domain-containing protein n=1 Tax=Blautia massiliensis (ex Durand et al. 2017) TaxID=1737424 RepID=UPI00242E9AE7|nr:transglutaminase domain-containing protein [Blautia massiliensis (ex Durand et al. 2017)]MDD6548546.1 transglutaminase domain-containing protein [Blautia massiliensis (ex Durand et al. 2017)]
MKKRNFCPMAAAVLTAAVILQPFSASAEALDQIRSIAKSIISGEPKEVEELRQMEVAQSEEGHQEYYFKQLTEEEQRVYRELLKGIRAREKEFYLTISDDDIIDRSYHAVLKDHPEIFWVHNREKIYKTTYSDSDYCVFTPGYTYTDGEIDEIQTAMEQSFQEVRALIPEDAGDYEKVRIVYTYVIDHTQYQTGEDDQSIAGVFWKKSAVCAGYAGAVQYLLERLDIPCIYVDGSTKGSTEGHAWDIVKIGQEYYYVDATNGDQPDFLNGDAAQLEEHKTIIYDYLCPFPEEYEKTYTPSEELTVPACTAKDLDFYVLNQGYFEDYSWQDIYDYCKMRMDNGAAVVRFKFGSREAFSEACQELLDDGVVQNVAQYYMKLHGLGQVEYHYGVMDNFYTIYFIF